MRREKERLPLHREWASISALWASIAALFWRRFTHSLETMSPAELENAAMQCNPIVYLTEFDDRAELPETVIAQVEEYLFLGWAGARSKL